MKDVAACRITQLQRDTKAGFTLWVTSRMQVPSRLVGSPGTMLHITAARTDSVVCVSLRASRSSNVRRLIALKR
jgi:hypothetical protein